MLGLTLQSSTAGGLTSSRQNLPHSKIWVQAYDIDNGLFLASDKKEHYLGAAFVSLPLTGATAATIEQVKSALSAPFPPGTFVQIGLLSNPDIENTLGRYLNKKRSCQDEVLRELAQDHVDLFRRGIDDPIIRLNAIKTNFKRVIVTLKLPVQRPLPTLEDLKVAKEAVEKLQEALKAAGIHSTQLDASNYLRMIRRIADPWAAPDNVWDQDIPIAEQVFPRGSSVNFSDPATIAFNGDERGENATHYVKVLSVKRFPKKASLAIMNHVVGEPAGNNNQMTDPYYMVLTLHYPDQVKKIDSVRGKSSYINHQCFGPTAKMIPTLGYKKAGIDVLVHEIEGKSAVVVEANFSIFLFAKQKQQLNKLSAGLEAYYTSLGLEMKEDRRILEALWNNFLPLNTTTEGTKNLFRFHTLGVRHAVQFLPVIGEWTGSTSSGSLMLLTRRGEPATFDIYDSATNYNGIVFAEPGAGKSFLTQKIVSDYLAEGAKVWAIDAGRSYYKLCKATKGTFIEFQPESKIILNPFTFVENLDDDMDIIKTMIAKMAAPETALSDYEMSLLENAISGTFSAEGKGSTVAKVASFLREQPQPEAQRLATQLFSFSQGQYSHWFEGTSNLNMDNDFVVLELAELKGRKALQQVVLLQLMARINYEMFLTRGRKKILIIDEAWELLDDPIMGKAIEAMYRKARKERGAVIIVTQSIADLYRSSNAVAIASNSAWQFILQQNHEAIDAAIADGQFKIDSYGASMLKTVHTNPGQYSEVMVKRGQNWGIFRLAVSRFTQEMYSTKDNERDDIFNAIDRGESVVDAVRSFISVEQQQKTGLPAAANERISTLAA